MNEEEIAGGTCGVPVCDHDAPLVTCSTLSWLPERRPGVSEPLAPLCPQLVTQSCRLLARLVPMLSRYSDLVLFFLTMSLATHRSTAKLLSVLAQIFTELAQKVRTVSMEYSIPVGVWFDGLLF